MCILWNIADILQGSHLAPLSFLLSIHCMWAFPHLQDLHILILIKPSMCRLDWGEGYTSIEIIFSKTRSDLKYLLDSLYYLAGSWAPYIHVILPYVVPITWYINQPLVRILLRIINLSVSMISLTQVWTAQWSNTIHTWNVQFQVGIHLTLFCFNTPTKLNYSMIIQFWT